VHTISKYRKEYCCFFLFQHLLLDIHIIEVYLNALLHKIHELYPILFVYLFSISLLLNESTKPLWTYSFPR